jgi:hypothetical protein
MTDAIASAAEKMGLFDTKINELKSWFFSKEHFVTECSGYDNTSNPISGYIYKRNPNGLVFRSDIHLELGHPSAGSCCQVMTTGNPSLVEDGCIHLLGPDISDIAEKKSPFSLVAIAYSTNGFSRNWEAVERIIYKDSQLNGLMTRIMPNKIWVRVSREAVEAGFNLTGFGAWLIAQVKKQRPDVSRIELFISTNGYDDFHALNRLLEEVQSVKNQSDKYRQLPDGTFECESEGACDECPEQEVCDTIKDVLEIRKGNEIITITKEDFPRYNP